MDDCGYCMIVTKYFEIVNLTLTADSYIPSYYVQVKNHLN